MDPADELATTLVLNQVSLLWSQIPVERPPIPAAFERPPVPGAPDGWDARQVVTEIYQAQYKSLIRLALLLVHDVPTAEEVVQDAFEAMYAASGQLRDIDKSLSYLRQAVVNRSRSVLRHRTVMAKNAPTAPDEPSAEYGAFTAIERNEVVAALRKLPDRQREALVLRYYADLSGDEIAAAMSITPAMMKTHTARGMAALRSMLERADEIEQPGAASRHPAPVTAALPISIYLADKDIHAQVEAAVEAWLATAGIDIEERQQPVIGSWFRRMRATAKAALNSETAQDLTLTAVHAADTRLVLAQDAATTATLLANLGPVIASLQPTKDAAIRAGALLIIKVDWAVQVIQLTAAQQALLDHRPHLASDPHQMVAALQLSTQTPEHVTSAADST